MARQQALATLVLVAAILGGCGLLSGRPEWCGQVVSGGPMPPSGSTPYEIPTPDSAHLACIAVVNRSDVDFALSETAGGEQVSWSLIQACEGMTASEPIADSWSLAIGQASGDGGISEPALARFDSSQLTGQGPYLIEVVVNEDRSASITQRSSLPWDPASSHC
jgi:hypothetical protein